MSDDLEKLHRDKARKLATDLLRDPVLALQYRDLIFDSFEDSASERKVTQWMTKAGYATRHELLHDELVNAPTTNLAAWDGAYVIRVDGRALVSLQVDVVGVRVNGSRVSSVAFTDGVLCFEPSSDAPWSGELRFSSLTPMTNNPLSDGGTFQRTCTGKLWKKGAAKPDVPNAVGATKRIDLLPSPPDVVANVVVRARPAAALFGDSKPVTFVGKWKGDYKVTQISNDPKTGDDITKDGPDYGVTGESDKKVKLTFIDPFEIDLSPPGNQPEADHIVYTGGSRKFDLEFGEFGGDVRGFSGKIYPADAKTPPTSTNVTAVARSPLSPEPSSGDAAVVDVGLAIAVGTFVAAIGGIIAVLVGVKYADSLTAQREYEKAVAENNAPKMKDARKKLTAAKNVIERLPANTKSDVSDVALFGSAPAKELWAKKELIRIAKEADGLKARANKVDIKLQQLTTVDIPAFEQNLQTAIDALERVERDVDSSRQDKLDAEAVEQRERDALQEAKDKRDRNERKREEMKIAREKLESDLKKVHELR